MCSAVGSHRFEARTGHHLPPAPLTDGGDVFGHLGTDFTLLCIGTSEENARVFSEAAASLSVPLKMVALTSGLGGERYDAKWVLVRPDDFVAWTTQEEEVSPQTAALVLARASANASPEALVNKDV